FMTVKGGDGLALKTLGAPALEPGGVLWETETDRRRSFGAKRYGWRGRRSGSGWRMVFRSRMWITPLPPTPAASEEGSHGSTLGGNDVPSRLGSGWKSTPPRLPLAEGYRTPKL